MRPAACREERSAMIWSAWTLLGLGTNYEISTLQVDTDGSSVYMGGRCSTAGRVDAAYGRSRVGSTGGR